MVQIGPPKTNIGSQLGEALGSGLSAGIQQGSQIGLQQHFQNLQKQAQAQERSKSAGYLAEQLFGPGQSAEKQSLVSMLSNLDPQDQIKGIQKLEEAKILNQYLTSQQQSSQPGSSQQEHPFSTADQSEIPAIGSLAPLARQEMEKKKFEYKKSQDKASKNFEIAKPTLISNAERAEALPQKEAALESMVNAIESKNLGFFTRDNLAEITGLQGFMSPEGAVFKSTGKEFFLGSLKRAGARPNQWIEQQISDMLPKIGRSTEANLSVAEALKTEIDVEKKQIELTNSIADRMEKEQGFIGRDLSSQVQRQLSPYANEKQKELKEKLQSIKDRYEPMNKSGKLMYDPEGNLRRIPLEDIRAARKAKYRDYE